MDLMLWLLVVAFVWLAVLTVGLLALVRAVGALHLTRERAGEHGLEGYVDVSDQGLTVDFENDGPAVGSVVPDEARTHMAEVDGLLARLNSAKDVDLVMFSNGCDPCIERARDWAELLRGGGSTQALTVALVSGNPGGDVTKELVDGVDIVVEGEQASNIGRAMGIHTIPFAVRLSDGVVTGKSYIRYRQHLMATFELRETEPA